MLSRSPLSMVLAQIRFPKDLVGLGPSNSAVLDEAMDQAGFPLVDSAQDMLLDVGSDGLFKEFRQAERREYATGDLSLSATIGVSYISLFCVNRGDGIRYEGHGPFIKRLGEITRLLEPVIGGVSIARLGYRYVDYIPLDLSDKVLNKTFLGAYSLALCGNLGFSVSLPGVDGYFSETGERDVLAAEVPAEAVRLSSRVVEPRSVIDQAIPQRNEPLWVVDMDSYSLSPAGLSYSRETVERKMSELAQRARKLFYEKIIIKNEFERHFG